MIKKLIIFAILMILIPGATAQYFTDITVSDGQRPYQFNITLSNSSGTNTNTTLYLNGHAGTNFSSVYFSNINGNTIFSHYIPDNGSGHTWINATANGTIRVWYGNLSRASSSNGSLTFPLFCCDTPSLNASSWTVGAGTPTIANNNLTLNAAGEQIKSIQNFGYGYSMEFQLTATVTTGSFRASWNTCNTCIDWNPTSDGNKYADTRNGGITSLNDGAYTTARSNYRIDWINSSRVNFYYNGAIHQTSSTNIPAAPLQIMLTSETANSYNVDNFFLRNITYPELGVTAVTIEQQINYIPIIASNNTEYSNDASIGINSITPIELKIINITENYTGSWIIQYQLYQEFAGAAFNVFGQIYKNDIPYGSLQSTSSVGWTVFNETFSFNETTNGNKYSIYAYRDPALQNSQLAVYRIKFDYDYANSTIIPIYPSNSSSISFSYPPQFGNVNFSWSAIGISGYEIMIAKDNNFNIIVTDITTLNSYYTQSLESGLYYWKVRTYNDGGATLGNWSNTFSFSMIPTTAGVAANSSSGIVYQIVNDQIIPIEGAKVEIYNTTFYNYMITGSNGYYLFTNLSNGSTYSLKASLVDEFDDSPVIPVTVTNVSSTVTNILMQRCTTIFTCGLNKQFITFAVQDIFFNRYDQVTLTVYKDGDLNPYDEKDTDTTGRASFYLLKTQQYRITAINVSQGISQTVYIIPGDVSAGQAYYVIIVSPTQTYFSTPDNPNLDLTITPSSNVINATAAYINVSYFNNTGHSNQIKAIVNKTNLDGTITTVNTTTVTTSNFTFYYLVTPYSGSSYTVILKIYDDSLVNTYNFAYGFAFPMNISNTSGYNDNFLGIIAVMIILFVAAFFSETSVSIGALVTSGVAGILRAMGFMNASWFGSHIDIAIEICIVISIVYLIIQRANKEQV